jgi:hypothetical protein
MAEKKALNGVRNRLAMMSAAATAAMESSTAESAAETGLPA